MPESNAQHDEESLRRELALREREFERHRRSSSARREEAKTRRMIAFLCILGLLVAGGVTFLVADLIMKKSTDRAIAIERERMLDQRKLAEFKAELDRAVTLARAEAESLNRFPGVAAGRSLAAQIELANLHAELATQDETKARWSEIKSYLEGRVAAHREELDAVEKKIAENRQSYTATVNEIIRSRTPSADKEEKLAKLDAELAGLRVTARRLMFALAGAPESEAAAGNSGTAETTGNAPASGPLVETANVAALANSLPLPQPRPDGSTAALAAPTPLAPLDGTVLEHFPRQTVMTWSPVPGAADYTVEVDCFACCKKNKWCSEVGEEYLVVPGVAITRYGVNFGDNKQGRWRVWAVTSNGASGAKSAWSAFTYVD